ncbi:hypothetical protein FSP39_002727 [Pinctada imbricata]|uniref:Uncharacterized protein n=1 Tax=Pinctada imbricata TaxID=66713 RepID=A0AA89C9M6_PINIB|nr:hypothetical protein FSP39_002727 [Pinctada imbricata]
MLNKTKSSVVEVAPPLQRMDNVQAVPHGSQMGDVDYEEAMFVVMVIVGIILAVSGMALTVLWLYRKRHNTRDGDMTRPLRQASTDSAYVVSKTPSLGNRNISVTNQSV